MGSSIMSDVNFNRVNPMHKVPSQRDEEKDESKKKKKDQEQHKEKEQEQEEDTFTSSKEEEVKKDASNPGYTMDWVHLQKIKKRTDPDSPKDIENKKKN